MHEWLFIILTVLYSFIAGGTLRGRCTATKIPFMYSFSGNSAASAPISTFVCLWAIYIVPGSVYICPPENSRPIMGICKSLTDVWMWKLGLRPRYFFFWEYWFRNFCILSLQCGLKKGGSNQSIFSSGLKWIGLLYLWEEFKGIVSHDEYFLKILKIKIVLFEWVLMVFKIFRCHFEKKI